MYYPLFFGQRAEHDASDRVVESYRELNKRQLIAKVKERETSKLESLYQKWGERIFPSSSSSSFHLFSVDVEVGLAGGGKSGEMDAMLMIRALCADYLAVRIYYS